MDYLGHHHILALANVCVLGLDDRLEELEVLHVSAVRLDATYKVLDDAFSHFTAQSCVVTEQHAQCLGFQQLPQHNITH